MIVLTIPESTPSLNRMLGVHWAKKLRQRKHWAWLVKAARLHARAYESPRWPRARLTIERYGPRWIDPENFAAGTKFLTDSLVAEGFILDDSPKVIGKPTYTQIVSKTERKTIITIEAAE